MARSGLVENGDPKPFPDKSGKLLEKKTLGLAISETTHLGCTLEVLELTPSALCSARAAVVHRRSWPRIAEKIPELGSNTRPRKPDQQRSHQRERPTSNPPCGHSTQDLQTLHCRSTVDTSSRGDCIRPGYPFDAYGDDAQSRCRTVELRTGFTSVQGVFLSRSLAHRRRFLL